MIIIHYTGDYKSNLLKSHEWYQKYAPKNIKDVYGHPEPSTIKNSFLNFNKYST